jgi:formamidopyrimidine-DNA glycosylase
MPELPEVETVRRGLSQLVVGQKILDVKVFNQKSFEASADDIAKFLLGATICNVRRRAKVLVVELSSNYSLVIHLKMTGQLVFRGQANWAAGHPNDSFVADLPDRSTRLEFVLSNHAKLFFNDQRKFGWIKLLPSAEVENIDFLKKVGPEPLSGDKNLPKIFLSNMRRHNNTCVKAALLNQAVIAGIGNIYADESLWAARIHPATRVQKLSDSKLRKLLKDAREVMSRAIASGGSTMQNYIRADGTKGDYLEQFAKVFRREGLACPRCSHQIIKVRVAGRGTHICPHCQKEKL